MVNEIGGGPEKTPLYDIHTALGGKIVDFHGWLLPVQYGGILKEHECVRESAGLFDVSHMGEIEVSGPGSLDFLQMLLTNQISTREGRAVYSPMCYPWGGTVDDLIVYKLSDSNYLMVVNASNTEKDYQWMLKNKTEGVTLVNRSAEYSQLALQGPAARGILGKLVKEDLEKLPFFNFINGIYVDDIRVLLSRTGYTGEDGFELYLSPADAVRLWDMLMDRGKSFGLVPAGLGARDTLRLESALPLYGHELSENISPVMAGLGRFIKPDKGEFIGRGIITEQVSNGVKQKLAGFEMVERAVPRNGYEVYCNGAKSGYVTSGGYFPTLKKNMGLTLMDRNYTGEGSTIEIKVRDRLYGAKIVRLPFYKR